MAMTSTETTPQNRSRPLGDSGASWPPSSSTSGAIADFTTFHSSEGSGSGGGVRVVRVGRDRIGHATIPPSSSSRTSSRTWAGSSKFQRPGALIRLRMQRAR